MGQCKTKVKLDRFPVKSPLLDPIFNLDLDLIFKTGFRFLFAGLIVALQPQLLQVLPRKVADG